MNSKKWKQRWIKKHIRHIYREPTGHRIECCAPVFMFCFCNKTLPLFCSCHKIWDLSKWEVHKVRPRGQMCPSDQFLEALRFLVEMAHSTRGWSSHWVWMEWNVVVVSIMFLNYILFNIIFCRGQNILQKILKLMCGNHRILTSVLCLIYFSEKSKTLHISFKIYVNTETKKHN